MFSNLEFGKINRIVLKRLSKSPATSVDRNKSAATDLWDVRKYELFGEVICLIIVRYEMFDEVCMRFGDKTNLC